MIDTLNYGKIEHLALNEFIQGNCVPDTVTTKTPVQCTFKKSNLKQDVSATKLVSSKKLRTKWKTNMQEYKVNGVKMSQPGETEPELPTCDTQKQGTDYDEDMKQFISNLSSEISSARLKSQSRRNIQS